MKKIAIIVLILVLLTACQTNEIPEEPSEMSEQPIEEPELQDKPIDDSEQEPQKNSAFDQLMEKESLTAMVIGDFIRDNMDSLTVDESEQLIEQLVWYQQDLIYNMHTKIYQENYMQALNETMGGVLNAEKVQAIEDEEVRNDYQNLVDSYLTIVRYEETPVVETDWERLKQLNSHFSDDFSQMVTLWDKIQNYRYNRRDPALELIAEDAVKVEEIIKRNQVSFLTWQSELLYNKLVSNVLVGPEGSYVGIFIDKNSDFYKSLVDFSKEYSDSKLAQLIVTLDEGNFKDFQEITEIIRHFNLFGIKSDKTLKSSREEGQETLENISYINIPNDVELQVKINDLINQKAKKLVEGQEINARNHFFYGNENYASMIVSASYPTEESQYNYVDEYVVINLQTGEEETFDALIGLPFEAYQEELERIYKITIDRQPDYSIESNGLVLIFKDQPGQKSYQYLPITKLNQWVSFEKFYK